MKRQKPYEGPSSIYSSQENQKKTVISKNVFKINPVTEKPTVSTKALYTSEKSNFLKKLEQTAFKFQSEQSSYAQHLDQTTNQISLSTKKKEYKSSGQVHLIQPIKNVKKLSPQIRTKYDIQGPALSLQIGQYTVILIGRFQKVFQQGRIVGLYIPPTQQQYGKSQKDLDKTVIIKRSYQDKPHSTNFDVLKRPYLVLDPYNLLYPTYICNYIECKRRITLKHYIQGPQIVNQVLTAGTTCHRYLQSLVKKQIQPDQIEEQYKKVYNLFLYDMYLVNMSFQDFLAFCKESLKNLNKFYKKYLMNLPKNSKNIPQIIIDQTSKVKRAIKITKIFGPEIMLKSQYFGMKGKVDLILQGQLIVFQNSQQNKTQVMIPFELKTGKRQNDTHKRQVDIYLLLMREIYKKPVIGIVYYSQTDKFVIRQENSDEAYTSIVILRNQIISNILKLYEKQQDILLPEYAYNLANCGRKKQDKEIQLCQFAWECGAINQQSCFKARSTYPPKCSIQQIQTLIQKYSQNQVKYFRQWLCLLHLQEYESRKNNIRLENLNFNLFQINYKELNKLKLLSQQRIQLTMMKKFKSYADIQKVQGLFSSAQKIRFIIPQISLTQGAKIVQVKHIKKNLFLTVQMNNRQIFFSQKKHQILISVELSATGQIQKFQNTIYGSMRNTIAEFVKFGQKWLKDIVLGTSSEQKDKKKGLNQIEMSSSSVQSVQTSQNLNQLNQDQKNALLKSALMHRFLLVQGFPGTGKTFLITKMIQNFLEKGLKVLITTFTNRSLDNIIQRLLKNNSVSQEIITREGSKYSMTENLRHLSYRNKQFKQIKQYQQYFDKKRVWFVTMSSLFIHHIPEKFDIVIVDQASQCLQPLCIQAIKRASKFILIGDTKQLQSVVSSKKAFQMGMGKSLFEKLLQKYPQNTVSLKIQYRMCKSIMSLSNRLVYNGQLCIKNQSIQNQRLKLKSNWRQIVPESFQKIIDSERQIVFLNLDNFQNILQRQNNSDLNQEKIYLQKMKKVIEIQITAYIYKTILKVKQQQNRQKIGIICAYNSSVSSLVSLLIKQKVIDDNIGDVLTIDRSQGIDKQTIIFLLQKGQKNIVDNEKRLNVALTRAKSKLVIISSEQQLSNMNVHDGTLAKLLLQYKINLTKQMLEVCLQNSNK